MTNLLKRFQQESVGSDNRDFDYLPKIEPKGDFKRIEGINAIINSWNNILLTPKRSYPYDPEYGSNLYRLVFDPVDDETAQKIIDEVVLAIELYDDRATIDDIKIYRLRNGKGFSIDLFVEYEGETGNLSLEISEQAFSGLLTTE
jgi:phage baseplate assembly protein W